MGINVIGTYAIIAVGLGVLVAAIVVGIIRLARERKRCSLCGQARDPRSKNDATWKYGIFACEACAAALDEKYRDEWPPPPGPPTNL